jgi:hypothetical protein
VRLPDISGWPFWRGVLIGVAIYVIVKALYHWMNP